MRDSGPHPRNAPVCKKTMQAQYTDPATSGVTDRFALLNVDFETMCDITSMCAYVLDVCVHANSSLSTCIQRSILSTVSLTRSSMSSRKSSKRSTCILYFCTSAIAAIADATSCKGLGHKCHQHNKHKKIRKLSGFALESLEDTKSTNDNQSRHISADSLFIVELKILALAAVLPQGTVDTC